MQKQHLKHMAKTTFKQWQKPHKKMATTTLKKIAKPRSEQWQKPHQKLKKQHKQLTKNI